eukprot:3856260-Amphidinium_carterae.1
MDAPFDTHQRLAGATLGLYSRLCDGTSARPSNHFSEVGKVPKMHRRAEQGAKTYCNNLCEDSA